MKRARSNKRKRTVSPKVQWLLLLTIGLIVAAAVGISMLFLQKTTMVPLEEPVYQYFQAEKQTFGSGTKLVKGEYNVVFEEGDQRNDGDETPIYYAEKRSFILAEDMSWGAASGEEEWLIPAYSTIEQDDNGLMWCVIGEGRYALSGGVLSNGQGSYIFLDPVTFAAGRQEEQLQAFSFYYLSQGLCRIYEYGTDAIRELDGDSLSVRITAESYTVDLNAGILLNRNGTSQLLTSSPQSLPDITTR